MIIISFLKKFPRSSAALLVVACFLASPVYGEKCWGRERDGTLCGLKRDRWGEDPHEFRKCVKFHSNGCKHWIRVRCFHDDFVCHECPIPSYKKAEVATKTPTIRKRRKKKCPGKLKRCDANFSDPEANGDPFTCVSCGRNGEHETFWPCQTSGHKICGSCRWTLKNKKDENRAKCPASEPTKSSCKNHLREMARNTTCFRLFCNGCGGLVIHPTQYFYPCDCLPKPWETAVQHDEKREYLGETYYWNPDTNQTQWEAPGCKICLKCYAEVTERQKIKDLTRKPKKKTKDRRRRRKKKAKDCRRRLAEAEAFFR